MKFKDKVVLVTGSSKGIGKAIALAFAKEGAKVVINYNKSEKEANEVLEQINKLSSGIVIRCDVSKEKAVKDMIKSIMKNYGRIDILINNAGHYIDGDEWNGSSKIWKETFEQNIIPALNVSKYVAEVFIAQKSGAIVNISSRYSLSGVYDSIAYSASKAGIANITQAYSKLLAPFGKVNTISPSAVRAGYWLRAPKDELENQIASMPNKKLIEPEEIANLALDLCSETSKRTGENILVDGKR